MQNADIFLRNPLHFIIPNNGVAKLDTPHTQKQWDTLRWELESFVSEGQYAQGMKRMLDTYLGRVSEADQPGWWVSGFSGSGKSHFVRVLEHVWADTRFPDGVSARELVKLPSEVMQGLRELSTVGRREGGLWAASGTLGAGAEGSVRLGFAAILFRAAGLPESYQQARLVLWLRERQVLDSVRARVEVLGEDWESALNNMFVSQALTQAILEVSPDFRDEADVRTSLRTQFPKVGDLTEDELLRVARETMATQSGKPGKLPCTLVVIDEVQQFIGDIVERVDQVARLAESVTKGFGGKLLLVATGQSAMGATPQLAKIKDRFPMSIELTSTDVEQVVRRVILRKDPAHLPALEAVLEDVHGEIDRHLKGTDLASRESDRADWAADYPVLPTRRRLWDEFLRTIDGGGSSTQLRSQLRIMHEASKEVAQRPLGQVIGAEFVYRPVAGYMRSVGALLDDTYTLIEGLGQHPDDGPLRQRVAQLLFVISRLDARQGVKATEATLADLLIEDLGAGNTGLRVRLPELLQSMVQAGQIMKDRDEYRLQTREGAEWEGAYSEHFNRLVGDTMRQTSEREALTKKAVDFTAKGQLGVTQGASKTPRKAELFYDVPPAGSAAIPAWVRFGWNGTPDQVRQDALAAGNESPMVYVYLPEPERAKMRDALASTLATEEVLSARPNPGTPEARQAQSAMRTRQANALDEAQRLILQSVDRARVFQAGGQELDGGLRGALKPALEAAVSRLYPRFSEGDHARWDSALRSAKQGNRSALESVGHLGGLTEHPVLRAVLADIGAGKRGGELRKTLTGIPYGWPQDAVDTALILLTLEGHLRASVNGSVVEARQLDAATLAKADFRPEMITLTALQRVAVRKLYGRAGLNAESGKEAAHAAAYVTHLKDLVEASGGEAPLPERLPQALLSAIQGLSGSEQLLAMAESSAALETLRAAAEARKELIVKRLDHWNRVGRLLRHNKNPELQMQADAISQGRLLLADPDPMEPLRNDLMNGLRAHLNAARAQYGAAYTQGLQGLETSPQWQALTPDEQTHWLKKGHVAPLEEQKFSSINEIVSALDQRSLGEWQAINQALPSRFEAVRMGVVRAAEPQARMVKPLPATLKTEADVQSYLDTLRKDLLKSVQGGEVVVIL